LAASAKITVGIDVTEIGSWDWDGILKKFAITAAPDAKYYSIVQQAVADTEEALALGDVATIEAMLVHCITNDVDLDTAYASSFEATIEVQEGEWAIFKPKGTVYFKNDDAAEQSTFEYWLIGTK
jgi:hypothetical protein